jgi:hypothetical protein
MPVGADGEDLQGWGPAVSAPPGGRVTEAIVLPALSATVSAKTSPVLL